MGNTSSIRVYFPASYVKKSAGHTCILPKTPRKNHHTKSSVFLPVFFCSGYRWRPFFFRPLGNSPKKNGGKVSPNSPTGEAVACTDPSIQRHQIPSPQSKCPFPIAKSPSASRRKTSPKSIWCFFSWKKSRVWKKKHVGFEVDSNKWSTWGLSKCPVLKSSLMAYDNHPQTTACTYSLSYLWCFKGAIFQLIPTWNEFWERENWWVFVGSIIPAPSWQVTYPLSRHSWRWFSAGGYM